LKGQLQKGPQYAGLLPLGHALATTSSDFLAPLPAHIFMVGCVPGAPLPGAVLNVNIPCFQRRAAVSLGFVTLGGIGGDNLCLYCSRVASSVNHRLQTAGLGTSTGREHFTCFRVTVFFQAPDAYIANRHTQTFTVQATLVDVS